MQLVALAVRAPEMTTPVTFTAQKLQVLLPSRLMYPMLSLSISRHRQPSEAMSFSAYLRMRWCDHCGGQVTYPPTQQHLFSNFIRATQRNTIVPPMLKDWRREITAHFERNPPRKAINEETMSKIIVDVRSTTEWLTH
jgi:hypothetical protein